MMEFLEAYNLVGLVIGVATFLIIGLFHPLVIKGEYYFGVKIWWVFLVIGIVSLVCSFCVDNVLLQSVISVFAFSSFWSIHEVFEQKRRVERGWFPKNPKRK
jgi:hypothetical protein